MCSHCLLHLPVLSTLAAGPREGPATSPNALPGLLAPVLEGRDALARREKGVQVAMARLTFLSANHGGN